MSPSYLASTAQMTVEEVQSTLTTFPDLEYNQDGKIVSVGLSLLPTPHRLWFNEQALFAWCALDTLMYPVLLQQSAKVESPCLVTGQMIRLTVTPTRILNLEPPEAVVSLVAPTCSGQSCCTRGDFCDQVHFFSSEAVAKSWQAAHHEGEIVSVAEAYHLGQALAQRCVEPQALPIPTAGHSVTGSNCAP
ncbi:MAG: hypothetical protein Fur0022_00600 [Anaerolineales bacterium]